MHTAPPVQNHSIAGWGSVSRRMEKFSAAACSPAALRRLFAPWTVLTRLLTAAPLPAVRPLDSFQVHPVVRWVLGGRAPDRDLIPDFEGRLLDALTFELRRADPLGRIDPLFSGRTVA